MNNAYTLIIRFLGEIEFKCSLSHDLAYRRVLQDESNYKEMIEEIIKEGRSVTLDSSKDDSECHQYNDKYETVVTPVKTPQELVDILKADFECELVEELKVQFTVTADGADFGFEDDVMAESSKYGVNNLSTLLFNASNDSEYEPQRREQGGSYELSIVDAVENKEGIDNIVDFLTEIQEGKINHSLYKEKGAYSKFIDALEELPAQSMIESLRFEVRGETIDLDLDRIQKIKKIKRKMYHSELLNYRTDTATAINVSTRKFKIVDREDYYLSCTADSIRMIEEIKENEGKTINYIGYSLGPKSALIKSISIIETLE